VADELADWYVHTITATTDGGTGAYGPIRGDDITVPCFLDDTRKMVRSTGGEEVVSEATVYCSLDWADTLTPGTAVDLGYRMAEVIGVARRDAPGLDLPAHLEVTVT
jgi:hypothetical protein